MEKAVSYQPELVPTGIAGLDEILFGGIVANNVIVVEGMPGTGKTNFGLEFLYRGATDFNEPGVFISFEIEPEKVRRDSLAFGWDFQKVEAAEKIKLIYLSPLSLLNELELGSRTLSDVVLTNKAKRVVIDGLTPLRMSSDQIGARSYRNSLHMLLQALRKMGVTALLTTESVGTNPIGETSSREEQYLADTVITFRNQARRRSVHRSVEVAKSRGQEFITGRHSMKMISGEGIQVFPRVYARRRDFAHQPTSNMRIGSGIPTLDKMLGGGILEGAISLVVGISGTGKTVAGMQFLAEGARLGEKGLLVSLDEHSEQILRNARNLDMDFEGFVKAKDIFILYDSPLEVDLDEHFYSIKAMVEKHGITRVVIDSVATYESAQPEEAREFLVALATYFKSKVLPAYFNFECPELLGISQISDELKSSAMVDNIILLSYVEISTLIRRAISIPKARGSKPEQRTKEYVIDAGGIAILDDSTVEGAERVPQLPLSSYYSVLGRAPTRHSPMIDEHVASGKPLPKSKVPKPVPRVKRSTSLKKSKN